MAKFILALLPNAPEAMNAARDLAQAGFPRNHISIIGAGEHDHPQPADTETGPGAGAVIGTGVGLIAGLAALAIPGLGPAVVAGPLAGALAGAGIGAVSGGIADSLAEIGFPSNEAQAYAEAVRCGGVLVGVRTADDLGDTAARILSSHGARDLRSQSASDEEPAAPTDEEQMEAAFRRHFESHYDGEGHSYERYAPAYYFGRDWACDPRFGNEPWSSVEPQVRRAWESSGRGVWEEVHNAVRFGWDKARFGFC